MQAKAHAVSFAPPSLGWAPVDIWRRLRAVYRLTRVVLHLFMVSVRMPGAMARGTQAQHDALIQQWNADVLKYLGVQRVVHGDLAQASTLVVSNHVSWMDIMSINAVRTCQFVSKIEVAAWPLIGRMVTLAGTLYIDRSKRRDAQRVLQDMADSLRAGRCLAVFPEGTTGAGPQLLHFHANLLQAAIDAQVAVQAVVLRYSDATHAFSPSAAYIGDATLAQSLWWVACAEQLTVHVHVMPAHAGPHADRRALSAALHHEIAVVIRHALPDPSGISTHNA